MPFSVTVQNIGDTVSSANTILDVLVSVDGVDVGWSDNLSASLAPGASRVQLVNGGPDSSDGVWTVTAGPHNVQAYVNSGSLPTRPPIPESNRDNNARVTPFRVESAGTIAFISDRTGNPEVWRMNADGSNQTQLTTSTETERDPKLSPDGAKIVFVRRTLAIVGGPYELLWVMDADGTNQHQVFAPPATVEGPPYGPGLVMTDRDPAWSPDGSQIAFVRDGTTTTGILVMNTDGSGGRVLYPFGQASRMTDLSWSPDGTRIAEAYDFIGQGATHILVVSADGSGTGLELTGPHNQFDATSDEQPAWSPDSGRIAFVANSGAIRTINADGSNPISLTGGVSPSWSPDGQRITFERAGSIWNMNPDGSDQVLVTTAGGQPNWGPRH